MKKIRSLAGSGARILEGMGMALDSVRANKVRAALTILGVAIGVMVVIAMASAITGINRAVATQLETLGPKTFFVFRFFQGRVRRDVSLAPQSLAHPRGSRAPADPADRG